MRALVLLLVIVPGIATAQTMPSPPTMIVTSAAPGDVSVTLYRDPQRAADAAIDREAPTGFALISETRSLTLPAGVAVVRFEGVAGNILPESALVAGLPDGVDEKNLDASLLSPRSLYDRALGRRVVIRRSDRATGKMTMQQATIRSSADGAAVLQIAGDYTDLKCSGIPETIVYDGIPEGLSAKPTLSVRTESKVARKVTLTLSYLAGGFDWQADYIVTMRPNGRSADLFAWITLASNDVTSFVGARAQVVAGQVNREEQQAQFGPAPGDLALRCWPLPLYGLGAGPPPSPEMASPPPAPVATDIIVTGLRRRAAAQETAVPVAMLASVEQLGDLKVYRFPTPVTVAAKAQKQVAMLSKPAVTLLPIYRAELLGDSADTWLALRTKNTEQNGLGVALPSGKAAVFNQVDGQSLLVGESSIADKAVGEEVEFAMGESPAVATTVTALREKKRRIRYQAVVTNANPWPISYEAEILMTDRATLRSPTARLGKKNGHPLWVATVPANGTVKIAYEIVEANDSGEETD
ncbi:DUF4139 domain-containing protein [Sphingomonas lycopersici]|uniref:DUF4139 domain-containing protein n=1 Tax=Sphingomonas lycopersici TaxID=2951807 RepID=A0AA42CPP2_9SPHN|nr:hypothetical protein [Sphingomonas lycopersici]MCW6534032.1 hypothetical protein [Sphingomonas lycopersici]